MAAHKTIPNAKYTSTDEWVILEGSEALIGVTDYAQDALSNVTFVELPNVGQSFKAGELFGNVESVKAASDLHLPISGTVIAVNDQLSKKPELINDDPYQGGWFIRINAADPAEMNALMDEAAYNAYCAKR